MSARTDSQRMAQENQPDNQPLSRNSSSPRSFGTHGSYDRYVPSRPSTSYRDDYTYRASSWRPNERQTSHYNRTPSPNRYESPRALEDPWTRNPYGSTGWPDRRFSDLWSTSRRRDLGSERSFEPSEAWIQTHNDPRARPDSLPPQSGDRYLPTYPRDPWDYNQVPRSHGPDHYSPHSTGDHYRPYSDPYSSRDLFPNSRADSYRPQYQEDGPWNYSYSSVSRNPRARTPEDVESPRRESRSVYAHRTPTSHTERESRHYSPARPVNDISPRERKSSSPVSLRFNNLRNHDYSNRLHSPRHSTKSPGLFNLESSPPIPGLIHHPRSISTSESSNRSNFLSETPPKRRSPSSSLDGPSSSKKPRSCSPERQSSIASSRRSSPEPVIVVGHRPVTQLEKKVMGSNPRPLTPPSATGESDIALAVRQRSVQQSSVPGTQQTSFLQDAGAGPSISAVSQSRPTTPLRATLNEDIKLSPIPPNNHRTIANDDSKPGSPILSSPRPKPPDLAMANKSPEIPQPSLDQSPNEMMRDFPLQENLKEQDATLGFDVPSQSDIDDLEILHHSTSYKTKSMVEALKYTVMSRYLHDSYRRNERVEPILLSNLSIAERPVISKSGSSHSVMREIMEGPRVKDRREKFGELASSLAAVISHRQSSLSEKVQRLRSEYLELHQNWLEQCAKLDEAAKSLANDDAVAVTGRTTRRSAATLGDAVRSDLEMEQIIASLGNDDLTDANHLAMRNAATIPDMISVTRGYVDHLYDDTNNLVEDAADFYAQRTGIDDWTEEEKQILLEQYAAYPKQFGIIAESLPTKTTAQCVAFYYLHKKKHIDFRKVVQRYAPTKRRRGGRKTDKQRGNALLADIRKHDAEISSKDPDLPEVAPPPKRRPGRPPNSMRKPQIINLTPATTPTPTDTPDPESVPRSRGGRRLNMRIPIIIEDLSDDEEDGPKPVKKVGRRGRKPKAKPPNPEETAQSLDSQDTIGRRKVNQSAVHWSEDDQNMFIELVAQHGDNFKRIAASMPNKTTVQVSIFYHANLKSLDLDKVAASAPQRTPSPNQSPPAPLPPPPVLKNRRSRDREQGSKKGVCEPSAAMVGSPRHSPAPFCTVFDADLRRVSCASPDLDGPSRGSDSTTWQSFHPFSTVMGDQSVEVTPPQNYVQSLATPQHEPYFPSQQIPYSRQRPPVVIVPESELLVTQPTGSVNNKGETFYINDYQHSRGPHQTQSSSMAIIPGLVDVNVPDFDPQYHQPVIRVQQQSSQQEPPSSAFMTGRVLLSTKAYSGRS